MGRYTAHGRKFAPEVFSKNTTYYEIYGRIDNSQKVNCVPGERVCGGSPLGQHTRTINALHQRDNESQRVADEKYAYDCC